MKSFIAAIIMFGVLIAGSIYFVNRIDDISAEMISKNNEITRLIENEDFKEAHKMVRELGDYVDEKRAVISTTMDHSYADTMEIYICELEKYVENEGKSDALAKSKVLDRLFKYLPRNYKLKWENVL